MKKLWEMALIIGSYLLLMVYLALWGAIVRRSW